VEATNIYEGKTLLRHEGGLHARPSVKLTQLASRYKSDISLRMEGDEEWINGKSIAQVMKLKAPINTYIHIKVQGSDAKKAIERLLVFIEKSCNAA